MNKYKVHCSIKLSQYAIGYAVDCRVIGKPENEQIRARLINALEYAGIRLQDAKKTMEKKDVN